MIRKQTVESEHEVVQNWLIVFGYVILTICEHMNLIKINAFIFSHFFDWHGFRRILLIDKENQIVLCANCATQSLSSW